MIYMHWLILLIYGIVIIGTMVAVLMDRRQPAKTMAWVLVLIFLPVVGIILYFFFGQNLRKERSISQHSLDQLTEHSMLEFMEQQDLKLPEAYLPLINLFANQSLAFPFKGNKADIYTDGYQFFPALLADIARAVHHIHLTTYIIEDDSLGRLLSDALIQKAHEGVEIRLIFDDVGCWKVKNKFFERLRKEGIEVHSFMPVKFPAFTSKVNYRNHRKICIIDGHVGFIGGMNIALRYVKGNSRLAWRDTHLRIRGSAVSGLKRAFLVDWYFVNRTLITDRKYYKDSTLPDNLSDTALITTEGHEESVFAGSEKEPDVALVSGESSVSLWEKQEQGALMQVVTSSPTSPWPDIEQGYVRILLEAKHYVFMETPYFLPTEPILFAMRTAALAGTDVRLMLPLHGDAKLVEWASRSYVMETIEAGVKVYFYQAGFNHSKLLVCDDALASVGSANIDFRSFENNFEANVFIYDEELALRLKKVFLADQEECILLDDLTNLEHRPFLHRLWESLVRLLSPLL